MTDVSPPVKLADLAILVVGSGAREHALVWALRRAPSAGQLFAAPGNPGIAESATLLDFAVTETDEIADWASRNEIDLVVVGPEAALEAGLADAMRERGIAVFGGSRAACELEWSKAFAKQFFHDHNIPTAAFAVFDELEPALAWLEACPYPVVVKADGLAAGKGVIICPDRETAAAAVRDMLVGQAFGAAGATIVIEEFLIGRELSVTALCDGERFALLAPARDHKRLGDGDTGPNTGGMGAFAPVGDATPALLAEVAETVISPTIAGMNALGRPYVGALYAGLMLTDSGPKVLEFNCRFGDPETQVFLPLYAGDLALTLLACARGELDPARVAIKPGAATCVVLAAEGYPVKPVTGAPIRGIADAREIGALVFHAGTTVGDAELRVNGGRVLSVVGIGADQPTATGRAYDAAAMIQFDGKQFRADIAASELAAR